MEPQLWRVGIFLVGFTLVLAGCARELSRSLIAGAWTIDPAVVAEANPLGPESLNYSKAWVVVRVDGTFDWSGTLRDFVYHFDRLRRVGDCSFSVMDPKTKYRVLWVKYEPESSAIAVLVSAQTDDGSAGNEILMQVARQADQDHVRYWVARVVPGDQALAREYLLVRAPEGAEHLEPFYALPSLPAKP